MSKEHELELRLDDQSWGPVESLIEPVSQAFDAAMKVGRPGSGKVAVTIVLSDNQTVAELNNQWRSKDRATNILSFPAPDGEKTESGTPYLGDMILAYGVVAGEAGEQGKALATHLCHLVIHGGLHLAGYDHQNDEDAAIMEDLERIAMKMLNLPDPYLTVSATREENV